VIKKMGIAWQLRLRMAEQGLFQTTDLVPLLAERGIHLSREQVYRLVTQPPQRLSMDTLAALCDILGCTPNDLIEVEVANAQVRKTAEGAPTHHRQCGAALSDAPIRHEPARAASRGPCSCCRVSEAGGAGTRCGVSRGGAGRCQCAPSRRPPPLG
jgi:DNA-binding Xre family transcriptional regulator